MRILDEVSSKKLNRVILYLTASEAQELMDGLKDLIDNSSHHHTHISSEDYQKEITVCIYDSSDLAGFDERSKNLIINDE